MTDFSSLLACQRTIRACQMLKLMACSSCALLLVPAEILSLGCQFLHVGQGQEVSSLASSLALSQFEVNSCTLHASCIRMTRPNGRVGRSWKAHSWRCLVVPASSRHHPSFRPGLKSGSPRPKQCPWPGYEWQAYNRYGRSDDNNDAETDICTPTASLEQCRKNR